MTNPKTTTLAAALVCAGGAAVLAQDAKPSAKEQEAKLLAVLKNADATRKEKVDACRELGVVGSKDAVAPLAALLGDPKYSHMARYGLEPNPDPSVNEVLREALGKVKGGCLVGVIGSIGVRRDAQAVDALAKLLKDSDADVAQAAARALGKIGTPAAAKALTSCVAGAAPANRLALDEGLLRCAENMAAQNMKADACAIYECVQASDSPKYVKDGAACGAKRVGK